LITTSRPPAVVLRADARIVQRPDGADDRHVVSRRRDTAAIAKRPVSRYRPPRQATTLEAGMAKFLWQASYNSDGVKGVLKEGGTGRRAAIDKLVQGLGGKLEAFYFAFGGDDVVVIADLPDQKTAAAVGLAVNASGTTALKTVVLLTPEEIDESARVAVEYRRPGG
jgi:uncharacterized protein with GYD domain